MMHVLPMEPIGQMLLTIGYLLLLMSHLFGRN